MRPTSACPNTSGTIIDSGPSQQRSVIEVDWSQAPAGSSAVELSITVQSTPVSADAGQEPAGWDKAVTRNAWVQYSTLGSLAAGSHELKVWLLNPTMAMTKIVVGPWRRPKQRLRAARELSCKTKAVGGVKLVNLIILVMIRATPLNLCQRTCACGFTRVQY